MDWIGLGLEPPTYHAHDTMTTVCPITNLPATPHAIGRHLYILQDFVVVLTYVVLSVSVVRGAFTPLTYPDVVYDRSLLSAYTLSVRSFVDTLLRDVLALLYK